MLTARPQRSKDKSGGNAWNAFRQGGLPYGWFQTQGRRPHMEDVFAMHLGEGASTTALNCYGVFDGHSGARCAEYLRQNLFQYVANSLAGCNFQADHQVISTLKRTFCEVDQMFLDKVALPGRMHDGSTATTIFINGSNRAYVANTGDSRTVLSRLGTAIDMSKDHKPNRPDEKARIEQAGGHVSGKGIPRVSGLLATSRTFGDGSMKAPNVKRVCIIAEPEVTVWDISPGDEYVILASDGLWDVCSSQTAVKLAHKFGDPQKAAKALVELALSKGGNDNITVVVVDLRSIHTDRPPPEFKTPQIVEANAEFVDSTAVSHSSKRVVIQAAFDMASVWAMDPIQTGWLLKKKHGPTLFGDPWQRRWFSMHRVSVESDVESSVHDNWQVVQFVLHYHTSEKEFEAHKMSGQKLPRKPTALDPSYPARREHSQDTAGRYCFSVMNSDDGSILVLAAESPETAANWTNQINRVFLTDGGVNKLQAAPRGGWRQWDGSEDEGSWHSGGGTGSQHGSAYSGSLHGGSVHGGSMHGGSMHGGSMHGHGGSIRGADGRSSVHSVDAWGNPISASERSPLSIHRRL